MVQTCYICKWRADKLPRRSFHKFPFDEVEKQKWLDILGKSNISLGKRTSVCSIHFDKTCFRYGLVNGRELLRQGSVPTIQLTRPPEVDLYEDLYNAHPMTVEVKVEPHEDDRTEGIGANAPTDNDDQPEQDAVRSIHQNVKIEKDATSEDASSHKPITIEVPQSSCSMKTTFKEKSEQNSGKIVTRKVYTYRRKEILKKLALVRMLVERLRRDHVKLKNYIQTVEERQKTTKNRRRKKIEVS